MTQLHAYTRRARFGPPQPPAQVAHLSARAVPQGRPFMTEAFSTEVDELIAIAMLPFCMQGDNETGKWCEI